jgi:dimethylglycine dehydrogenase
VGHVTSSGPACWLGINLAMAFVEADGAEPGTQHTIPVLGRDRRATVVPDSPYDPDDARPQL